MEAGRKICLPKRGRSRRDGEWRKTLHQVEEEQKGKETRPFQEKEEQDMGFKCLPKKRRSRRNEAICLLSSRRRRRNEKSRKKKKCGEGTGIAAKGVLYIFLLTLLMADKCIMILTV